MPEKRYWPKDYDRLGLKFPKRCKCGEIHAVNPKVTQQIDAQVRAMMSRANLQLHEEGAALYVAGDHTYQGDDVQTTCSRCGVIVYHRPYLLHDIQKVCMACAGFSLLAKGRQIAEGIVTPVELPDCENPRQMAEARMIVAMLARVAELSEDEVLRRISLGGEQPDLERVLGLSQAQIIERMTQRIGEHAVLQAVEELQRRFRKRHWN